MLWSKWSRLESTCSNWDNRPVWSLSCSLNFRDSVVTLPEPMPWVIRPRDQHPSVHISFCPGLASFKTLPRAVSLTKLVQCSQHTVISQGMIMLSWRQQSETQRKPDLNQERNQPQLAGSSLVSPTVMLSEFSLLIILPLFLPPLCWLILILSFLCGGKNVSHKLNDYILKVLDWIRENFHKKV